MSGFVDNDHNDDHNDNHVDDHNDDRVEGADGTLDSVDEPGKPESFVDLEVGQTIS